MKTRVYDGFVKVDRVETAAGLREVVVATDSVAFLVYNKDTDELLFATQDRMPMMRPDNPQGTILEVGAGRFDAEIGVRGLVAKELKEELGVTVTEDEVQVLNEGISLALSPGILTERQYLAYVEVTSEQIDPAKRQYGERKEGEIIARRFFPVREISQIHIQDMKTWALLQWFLARNNLHRLDQQQACAR
jgi:8-oxo-dGTP pyrophosphatase MutT (NUDIX family)